MVQGSGACVILHQTWKTHDVPDLIDWRESWRIHNPGIVMNLWDDAECLGFVKSFEPELVELYLALPHYIMRVDMMRYVWMYHLGGIYADLDIECIGPMDYLDEPGVHLVEERFHPGWSLGNAVMASEGRHPFWQHVLSVLASRARRIHKFEGLTPEGQRNRILRTTGPYMLTDAWRMWKGEVMVHPARVVRHHCAGTWWK